MLPRHKLWLESGDIIYDIVCVAKRNKNYKKIVENVKDVRYREFLKLMTDHGYAEHKRRGSRRAFVFNPSSLGKADADFPELDKGRVFTMDQPHHSGDRVDPAAVKGALRHIEYIRGVMGGGETSE